MALRLGKHVYCEKPLTHTVAEARLVAQEAAKAKMATQMGTQIHAGNNYRRVVEMIQAGAIGKVAEVHTLGRGRLGGGDRPQRYAAGAVELALGSVARACPRAPVQPGLCAFQMAWLVGFWRRQRGRLGLPSHGFALLGTLAAPSDERCQPRPVGQRRDVSAGNRSPLRVPRAGEQPPVKLTWYSGERIPKSIHDLALGGAGSPLGSAGNLFVGDKGMMFADYGSYKLLPEASFAGYQPPAPSIPNSIGHHAEWIKACKEGTPTTCNFDYAAH